jgi:hypothetical protein
MRAPEREEVVITEHTTKPPPGPPVAEQESPYPATKPMDRYDLAFSGVDQTLSYTQTLRVLQKRDGQRVNDDTVDDHGKVRLGRGEVGFDFELLPNGATQSSDGGAMFSAKSGGWTTVHGLDPRGRSSDPQATLVHLLLPLPETDVSPGTTTRRKCQLELSLGDTVHQVDLWVETTLTGFVDYEGDVAARMVATASLDHTEPIPDLGTANMLFRYSGVHYLGSNMATLRSVSAMQLTLNTDVSLMPGHREQASILMDSRFELFPAP